MNIFSSDSLLGRFLGVVGDVVVLNLLFLVCSIPIITIGPALTALHYSCLKIIKGREGSAWKDFFHSFRQNFFQALVIWICFLLAGSILSVNLHFLTGQSQTAAVVLRYLTYALSIAAYFQFLYIFPVLAAFQNTTANLMRNAFLFTYMHLPTTLLLAFLGFVMVQLTLTDYSLAPFYLFCWCFFGFGASALFGDWFFYRIFRRYLA